MFNLLLLRFEFVAGAAFIQAVDQKSDWFVSREGILAHDSVDWGCDELGELVREGFFENERRFREG